MNRQLWNIDSQINSLAAEIEGAAGETPPHFLSVKHQELASLFLEKTQITREMLDRESAVYHSNEGLYCNWQAIERYETGSDPHLSKLWYLRGRMLAWQIERFENPSLCDVGIQAYDRALRYMPSNEQGLNDEVAVNRMNLLGQRYERDHSVADIEEAIAIGERQMRRVQQNEGHALHNDVATLYHLRGNHIDLTRATVLFTSSLQQSIDPVTRVRRTINLTNARRDLYTASRQIDQLHLAHEELRDAAVLCESDGLVTMVGECLMRWGLMKFRFFKTGAGDQFESDALQTVQTALRFTKSDEVKDEYHEMVETIATELSTYNSHHRSILQISDAIRRGENPLDDL